ncbi:hypothetical protein CWI36_1603p0010 [Hamiltosporidium magnivora]|uniref:Uncharacterized protein n=1 Tax=Hamiltosporidium magnivora TaxID=148818 RepID=A0A4Q9KZT2_9MICR|nr:hypothetical protein CWI36_1603p0010 [Hamiltosporidium magnivora]
MFLFLLITNIFCTKYLIKLKDTDLYLTSKDNKNMSVGSKTEGKKVEFKKSTGKYNEILISDSDNTNNVFDLEGGAGKLILYPMHGGTNQRFTITKDYTGLFRIFSSTQKCLEYSESSNTLNMNSCSDNKNQLYELIGEEGEGGCNCDKMNDILQNYGERLHSIQSQVGATHDLVSGMSISKSIGLPPSEISGVGGMGSLTGGLSNGVTGGSYSMSRGYGSPYHPTLLPISSSVRGISSSIGGVSYNKGVFIRVLVLVVVLEGVKY